MVGRRGWGLAAAVQLDPHREIRNPSLAWVTKPGYRTNSSGLVSISGCCRKIAQQFRKPFLVGLSCTGYRHRKGCLAWRSDEKTLPAAVAQPSRDIPKLRSVWRFSTAYCSAPQRRTLASNVAILDWAFKPFDLPQELIRYAGWIFVLS